ncbi:Putative UDP-glucose glucosyltransferase [Linum perenne]
MGTVVSLQPDQRDELAHGLINSGLPFLWVVRPNREEEESDIVLPDGLGVNGKVVRWAPQREVLAHEAVGCFVTHCGWNSTLEVVAAGKPVVACPIFADQVTNAKFLVDVYEVGVRMSRHEKTRLKRDEVTRLLVEATVGPKAEELRRNAARWKKKAEEAVAKGGSSERSVNDFVEMVKNNREVLAHQAVGCFVTHCGWNSTLEVIAAGKPVVACPIFAVGVRMTRHEKTRLKRDDVTRLLVEATVGPKAEELRRNAARWKKKAEEAVAEGGSSKRSVNDFVEMVKKNVSKT